MSPTATPPISIFDRSGLDVTLENISKDLSSINKKLEQMPTNDRISALQADMDERRQNHEKDVQGLQAQIDNKVDKERFKLVERIVFGAVAIILIAVVGAIVGLVIIK
jgi:Skp family chaperone for outer membrane proteins